MRLEPRLKYSCAPAMHCTFFLFFARELRLSAVLGADRRRLHVTSTRNSDFLPNETLSRALVSSPQTIITRLQPLVSVRSVIYLLVGILSLIWEFIFQLFYGFFLPIIVSCFPSLAPSSPSTARWSCHCFYPDVNLCFQRS